MSSRCLSTCLRFTFSVVFLLICLQGIGQHAFPEIDSYLKENQKALGGNVIAMAWSDGKFIYRDTLEKQKGDFGPRVQAPAGYLSSWLTAALVMTFVDEGKLTLESKVSSYVPIFATYMKSYINLRHCLTFTTGIQADAQGALKLLQKNKYPTLEDEVNYFASKREIAANPGTEINFSQIGPDVAARVLEVVSKKAFERLMQDRILRPLKMRSTTFSDENGLAPNPAFGALTTANDIMNFLSMILNRGMFEGRRILSEKAIDEMAKVQFPDLPVKYLPKAFSGLKGGLGCWVSGDGQTISSGNMAGTWPYVDNCRKYAGLLMILSPTDEPKAEVYLKFRELLDVKFTCAKGLQ